MIPPHPRARLRVILCLTCFIFISNTSIARSENPIKELFVKGAIQFERQQYEQSLATFQEVTKAVPSFAQAHFQIGLIHKALGKTPKAIEAFEEAVTHKADYAEAHDELSKLYYSVGAFEKARDSAEKAVELSPESFSARMSLGWIYIVGYSDAASAIPHFEKVIELRPVPYAHFGLGMAYFMEDQKFKTFEHITVLKEAGKTDLASQLEDMIRYNRYTPPDPGDSRPFENAKRSASQMTKTPSLVEDSSSPNMPVRLRSPRQKAVRPTGYHDGQSNMTGQQRLQALQQPSW